MKFQALAQRFADAFDQRDMKTVLEMLPDVLKYLTTSLSVRRQAALRQIP